MTKSSHGAAEARLRALRAQLNLHFMLNSLNAVIGLLTSERVSEAVAVTHKLADFLRFSLETDSAGFVTLKDELHAVDAYLEVEFVRFKNRLDIEIDCPELLEDVLVPSFILQPLVENSLRHAVAVSSGPARLSIRASLQDGAALLIVEDETSVDRRGAGQGTGTGHENIRERLDLLYEGKAALSARGSGRHHRAEIRLPIQRVCRPSDMN